MKITKIKLKLNKAYYPYITILFTPITVYAHHYGYEKLQKKVHSYIRKFKPIIKGIDTLRRRGQGFKDTGMIINFKIGSDKKVEQAFTKLKKLRGKKFIDKRDSY